MSTPGGDERCPRCETLLAPVATLCSNCGGARTMKATALPSPILPIVLGIIAGTVVAFVAGTLAEFGRADSQGHVLKSFWLILALQVVAIVGVLVGAVAARRAGRRALSFFMLSAGVAAIVPTAACDAIWW